MAKLVVFGSEGRREIVLEAQNTLGRHPENRIQILDRVVSKEHCVITKQPKGYNLKDFGSLNGTYVNKKRVEGDVFLSDGDEITLGNTRCMFLSEEITDSATKLVDVTEQEIESHIRSKVAVCQDRFLPEKEIADERSLRADYEKLRVVYELQRDIGLEPDIDLLLQRILERTFEFLNCDRGVVLMADEEGQFNKPRAYKTRNPDDKLVVSSTLLKQVQIERQGILSSDARMDTRFKEARSMIMQGIRSSMAVPIMHQDEMLGIMVIDSSVAVNAYTEKDLLLLSNIANQTAQLIRNTQMAKKMEKDAATRERFQRLLSPDLAEMVVSGELSVEKGGENRSATVLFADIRGFTSMSENMRAHDVLQMLNEYFEVMVEIVFHHEGTVDKFVGDEIMVLWGAPVSHQDDPARAVRAALDMRRALIGFNQERLDVGKQPIEVGIGINTGELVAGYIGSTRTMSYSVIGDTVNTGARLCSAAQAGQIIISENTCAALDDDFDVQMLEPIMVKGKAKPLKVYSVLGSRETVGMFDVAKGEKTASHRLPGE